MASIQGLFCPFSVSGILKSQNMWEVNSVWRSGGEGLRRAEANAHTGGRRNRTLLVTHSRCLPINCLRDPHFYGSNVGWALLLVCRSDFTKKLSQFLFLVFSSGCVFLSLHESPLKVACVSCAILLKVRSNLEVSNPDKNGCRA